MASSYSTNLKIELMVTGADSGTWGTNTNTNLGTAIEQAIIGYGNPDYTSDANLTITITNSSASQTARCLVLNVTSTFGSLTATRELVVPTIQKQYIVQNNTTGSQSITVKTSAGTGITVPTGRKAHLYVDGTNVIQMFDFVDINGGAIDGTPIGAASASTGAFTTLSASSTTNLSGLTASTALALDASKNVVSVTNTGTGSNVLATSPTLVTPALGTPSALVGTNITGTASGLTAGNVTTNANLTGDVTSIGNATTLTNAPVIAKVLTGYVSGAGTVAATDSILQAIQKLNGNDATNANLTGAITSVGNATSLGSFTSLQLSGALTDETGTGANVFATSPTLVTPILGTPTSGTLTNATGLPISTGVSGLGTGVATFLATPSSANLAAAVTDETGTGALVFATSPTLVTPALGTPSAAVLTNATGLPMTTGVTGILPSANGGTNQATAIFAGGLIQVAKVAALPGSPDANTLYIVTP